MARPKTDNQVRFTVCISPTLNAGLTELMNRRNWKRQKAVRTLLEKWDRELEEQERKDQSQGQDAA
jgi:hypothetical protein